MKCLRSVTSAVFFLFALVTLSAAINSVDKSTKPALPTRAKAATALMETRNLTFAQRVAYQQAIEDVYWRHRIWPRERPDTKPSLSAVMSQAQLESKVADYLQKSDALEKHWQRPIAAEELQAEIDRMAQHTRQPQVLSELFQALG